MNINKKKVILNNNSSNDLSVINTTSLMNRTNVNNSENKKNIQEQKEENQNEIMGIENVNQDDSEEENKEENTVEFIDEKEKRYKAQIEQLSSELEIEKKLNQSIKRKPEEEEIIETLKSKLNERRFKFNKLKTTNERQSQAIEQLTRELENSYKKKKR